MNKIDIKKDFPQLYKVSSKRVVEVDVPSMRFLMIDGEGDPGTSPAYAKAIEALFSVSYTAKFAVKRGDIGIDYGVMPLEGLWWADDWSAFTDNDRSQWKWTMMIHKPSLVPEDLIHESIETVFEKKGLKTVKKLRLEEFNEGRCAQILHIGPFTEEGPTDISGIRRQFREFYGWHHGWRAITSKVNHPYPNGVAHLSLGFPNPRIPISHR